MHHVAVLRLPVDMRGSKVRGIQLPMEVAPVDGLNVAFDRSTGLCPVEEHHPISADISTSLSHRENPKSDLDNSRISTCWLSVALALSIMITVAVAIVAGVEG